MTKSKNKFVILTATLSGWDLVDTTTEKDGTERLTIYDSKKEAQEAIDDIIINFPAGYHNGDEFKITPYERGIHEQKWLEDTGKMNE